MIIPFPSIQKVSANAYTVFQETFGKAIFNGQEYGSRDGADISDHPVSIIPLDATTDTPRHTIPPITASSLSIVTSSGSHVSCSIETSWWKTLRAGAAADPCLLRRSEPTSINSSLDGSVSAFSSAGASTLASLSITASFPTSLLSLTTFSASSSNTDSEPLSPISSFTSLITLSSDAGEDSDGASTPTAIVTPSTSSEVSSTDLINTSVFPTSLLPVGTPFPTTTILGSFSTPSPTTFFSPASPSPTTLSSSGPSESDTGEPSTSSTDDSSNTAMETTSFTTSFTSTIDSTPTITTSNSTISETQSLTTSETTSVSDSMSLTTTVPPSSSFSDPATNSTSFATTSSDTDITETSDIPSTSSISTETLTNSTFSEADPSSTIPPATPRTTRYIGATVITSLTITTHGKTSSALETITSTYVSSRSGSAPMTLTTVLVGPSGTLNNGNAERRNLSSGAIAGITLVCFLAVVAVLLWVLFAYRRRHRRHMHQNVHYAIGKRGVSPDGGVGSHSFWSSAALGGAYGTGRDQSNDSGFPIRTSPLQGEDEEYEGHQSSSAHSGVDGGPGSFEGGMVQSYVPDQGFATMPGLSGRRSSLMADGHTADRLRAGNADFASRAATFEYPCTEGRNQSLLNAAGLGSTSSSAPPLSKNSSPLPQDPFSDTAGGASFALGPFYPPQRARSASPPERSNTRASLLPTRTEPLDGDVGPQKDSRRNTEIKRNSSNTFQRRSLPPSSWPVIDNSNNNGKGHDSQSPSPLPTKNEPSTDTFGRTRSRSSVEWSSSGHGHTQGRTGFTSSQGHGSATASGENEGTSWSGSGSSGSHHGSTWSQKRRKRRSNSDDGGFFARAASLARTSIIAQPRRASATGLDFSKEDARRLVRPPSPVSRLVPSNPSVSSPSPAIVSVIPPSPPPTRVPSGLSRSQTPGTIRLPPMAPSAMTRASGTSMGLPVILATPSPLPTPNHAPDVRLDPRLSARLREIHNVQSSMSTIGLRDHEDYSRPILPLVNNRDSLTSASSEYSQPSRFEGDEERTPTQPTMVV